MEQSNCNEGKKIYKYPSRSPGCSLTLFTKQRSALEFYEKQSQPTSAVFSTEINEGGQRQFLFSTLDDFWRMYERQETKNYYEVVGTKSRSKLYLDLEFYKSFNPSKDGHLMLKTLITILCKKLYHDHGVRVEEKEYLFLEASDEKKFSVHVIFFSVVFESNLEVGRFVSEAMQGLSPEEFDLFQVRGYSKSSAVNKSFCDLKVYNQNQNFRLFLSSKYNQNRPLVLSKNNAFLGEEISDMEIFRRSLISNCQDHANLNLIILSRQSSDQKSRTPRLVGLKENYETSSGPFTSSVENFISKISAPGKIRHKKQYANGMICYSMTGAHYCRLKDGEHNSGSQIYFIYSPNDKNLYQKCFSEKCLNQSSKKIDIILTE